MYICVCVCIEERSNKGNVAGTRLGYIIGAPKGRIVTKLKRGMNTPRGLLPAIENNTWVYTGAGTKAERVFDSTEHERGVPLSSLHFDEKALLFSL